MSLCSASLMRSALHTLSTWQVQIARLRRATVGREPAAWWDGDDFAPDFWESPSMAVRWNMPLL
eukprot:9471427-Pyramimonas_sp.AAC.1